MGMGRVGNDSRTTGVGRRHVKRNPFHRRPSFFHDGYLIAKHHEGSGDFAGGDRSRKPALDALNKRISCACSRLTNSSPLIFIMEPITRLVELSVVTANLPLSSGRKRSRKLFGTSAAGIIFVL